MNTSLLNVIIYDICHRYKSLLLDKYPKIYVTMYEDMKSDFPAWLRGLLDYTELDIEEKHFQFLLRENTRRRPKKEDIHQHLRKGKAGEHKEKLQQETIDYLNSKFVPILETFKYS